MRADALFELTDAVLSAPTVTSLPHLSLEPVFRRSWGSLYDALAAGRIDAERVGELLVAAGPPEWPLTFGRSVVAQAPTRVGRSPPQADQARQAKAEAATAAAAAAATAETALQLARADLQKPDRLKF